MFKKPCSKHHLFFPFQQLTTDIHQFLIDVFTGTWQEKAEGELREENCTINSYSIIIFIKAEFGASLTFRVTYKTLQMEQA